MRLGVLGEERSLLCHPRRARKEGLSDKVAFEQRPEGSEGSEGRVLRTRGTGTALRLAVAMVSVWREGRVAGGDFPGLMPGLVGKALNGLQTCFICKTVLHWTE